MSDRYLFRGKTHCAKPQWVTGSLVHCAHDFKICDDLLLAPHNIQQKTIGQCTGLLDRNGKPIFEGDVFREPDGSIFVVVFDSRTASFRAYRHRYGQTETSVGSLYIAGESFVICEIIGNIHCNPGLLGGDAS